LNYELHGIQSGFEAAFCGVQIAASKNHGPTIPFQYLHGERAKKTSNPFMLKSKHCNFKEVESSRQSFDYKAPVTVSKVPNPDWKYEEGANDKSGLEKSHVEIDPFEHGRPMISNYKLLISGTPRPISFLSTVSKDVIANLASFSYFQVVDHDPPVFVIGLWARLCILQNHLI
jgi:hypothetical protein